MIINNSKVRGIPHLHWMRAECRPAFRIITPRSTTVGTRNQLNENPRWLTDRNWRQWTIIIYIATRENNAFHLHVFLISAVVVHINMKLGYNSNIATAKNYL